MTRGQGVAEPGWLARLRQDMTDLSTEAARRLWPGPVPGGPPYFNYRLEHVRQVERNATRLLGEVGGDEDVVLAAVWIHDRFQPQFEGADHPARAAAWAEESLSGRGFPAGKVAAVCHALAHHSDDPGVIPPEAHEARVLWDADKLAKVGSVEVVSFLCSAPAFGGQELTLGGLARRGLAGLRDGEARAATFYFESTRRRAREALATERAFYQALAREAAGVMHHD